METLSGQLMSSHFLRSGREGIKVNTFTTNEEAIVYFKKIIEERLEIGYELVEEDREGTHPKQSLSAQAKIPSSSNIPSPVKRYDVQTVHVSNLASGDNDNTDVCLGKRSLPSGGEEVKEGKRSAKKDSKGKCALITVPVKREKLSTGGEITPGKVNGSQSARNNNVDTDTSSPDFPALQLVKDSGEKSLQENKGREEEKGNDRPIMESVIEIGREDWPREDEWVDPLDGASQSLIHHFYDKYSHSNPLFTEDPPVYSVPALTVQESRQSLYAAYISGQGKEGKRLDK